MRSCSPLPAGPPAPTVWSRGVGRHDAAGVERAERELADRQAGRDLGAGDRLKLWAKLTGSRDVDAMSTVSKAGSVAIGTQYTW